jgi:hypothetical protein
LRMMNCESFQAAISASSAECCVMVGMTMPYASLLYPGMDWKLNGLCEFPYLLYR